MMAGVCVHIFGEVNVVCVCYVHFITAMADTSHTVPSQVT